MVYHARLICWWSPPCRRKSSPCSCSCYASVELRLFYLLQRLQLILFYFRMDSDDILRSFQHSRPSVVFNGTVLFHSAVQLSSKDNLVLSLHFFLEQHFNVPFLRAFGAPLFHYGNLRPELAYCLQSALLQVRTSNTDRKCLPSMSNILIWFSVAPIWSSLCRLCSKKVLEKGARKDHNIVRRKVCNARAFVVWFCMQAVYTPLYQSWQWGRPDPTYVSSGYRC